MCLKVNLMKRMEYIISFFLFILLLNSCTSREAFVPDTYKAIYVEEPMCIDGKMDEDSWQRAIADSVNHFYVIKDDNYKVKTSFRAMWTEDTLYFYFECQDKYITAVEQKRDGRPFFDDCAEVFLIPAGKDASMHFCFEVNLLETINDVLYFDDLLGKGAGVIKDYNPNIKIGVKIDGSINDNSDTDTGWTMEMALPAKAFNRVIETSPIAAGENWRFLAIRQNRDILKSIPEDEDRETMTNSNLLQELEEGVHQSNRFAVLEFVK